jgi:hypothetical protein
MNKKYAKDNFVGFDEIKSERVNNSRPCVIPMKMGIRFFKTLAVLFCVVFLFFGLGANQARALTYVSDTFTDTAGVLLENHTSDSGNTWAKQIVSSNEVIISNANRVYTNPNTNGSHM